MGAGDYGDGEEEEIGLDVAHGVEVALAILVEEEMGANAGTEGSGGYEKGRGVHVDDGWRYENGILIRRVEQDAYSPYIDSLDALPRSD